MSTPEELLIIERLVGQRETIAGLEATTAATGELGAATAVYGREAEVARKKVLGMNQVIFTMRRFAYFGTLALTGLAAGALTMGFHFDATMQESSIALTKFMGSTQAVNTELGKLFRIAAFSPFRFQDMTTAFRTMFPAMHILGISAGTVTQTIQAMVDSMAAAGRNSPGQLNRVATALQHMAFAGHLTGQIVNQLARDGLPIYAALSKELGLTGDQIHRIGNLGIPAQQALQALNKYIETTPGFMGAAERQSRTFRGAIQTFADFFSLISGAALGGVFGGFNRVLNRVNDAMSRMTKGGLSAHLTMGMFVSAADRELTPRFHNIDHLWSAISASWRIFVSLLRNVFIPAAILGFGIFTTVFLPPLTLFLRILEPLTHHLTLLRIILGLAMARILIFGTIATGARIATWLWSRAILGLIGVESLQELKTKALVYWSALQTLWVNRSGLAYNFLRRALVLSLGASALTLGALRRMAIFLRTTMLLNLTSVNFSLLLMRARLLAVRVAIGIFIIWARLAAVAARIWTAMQWLLNIALDANPIGAAILVIAGLTIGIGLLVTHLKTVTRWAKEAWHWLSRPIPGTSWLHIHLPTHFGHFSAPHIPFVHLQHGGTAVRGGWSVVGERGAELLHVPTGASVVPLSPSGGISMDRFGGNGQMTIRVPVYLDGRQLAEIVARHNNDFNAGR